MALQQNNHHPLPPAPGRQQQNSGYQQAAGQSAQASQSRPTKGAHRSRAFSFRSDNSGGSHKGHLNETHNEKEAKRLHSKADPTMAMHEAEPSTIAATAQQTMASLRMMEHTDQTGNVITDPDHSNPTRWRLERPLDTIRGFESAIRRNDRSSMINPGDNESVLSWAPRNSYYGNTPGRYQHASYYSDARSSRPQSVAFRSDNYTDQPPQGRWGPGPDRRRPGPPNGEQQYNQRGGGGQYAAAPSPGDQRSYDTTASGSGTSGERPGYVTDPTSSDNSFIERRQSPPKRQPEPMNDYGIGFNQVPEYQTSSFTMNGAPSQNAGPSAVPRKEGSVIRKPIAVSHAEPEKQKKRKSWFGLGKGN